MKCLMKYDWVKLPRTTPPMGKGLMGSWTKLASRAAFRKGQAEYCGHINSVNPGEWSGGIVGVKSILGIKKKTEALRILDRLSKLGYITHTLDSETKKLTYKICDWVVKCSGAECMDGNVYTSQGYGFLCLPRNITERLVKYNYVFEESDAWLDLWCHSVFEDPNNAFSFLAPIPIPSLLINIIKKFYTDNPNHYFLTGKTKPTEPRTYRQFFTRFLKRNGLQQVKFHEIRHTFAVRAIEIPEFDIKSLSEILGHKNVSFTLNVYGSANLQQKVKCMNLLNDLL